MRLRLVFPLIASSFLLASCNKSPVAPVVTDGPHARLTLKDGTYLTGRVLESTTSQVVIAGDDNQNHTVATSQVRSLEYVDASPMAPTNSAAGGVNAPPAVTGETRAEARRDQQREQRREAAVEQRSLVDADHERHYHPAETAVTSHNLTVPAGTTVPVRIEETIDSRNASDGQTYAGEVTKDIPDANGDIVIPRGSNAQIVIRSAAQGGRFKGQSDLVMDLSSISVGGKRYQVSTEDLVEKGRQGVGANRRTAEFAGGGSAFGAIVGALAGGGKGAAIGALSGAAAGTGAQVLTHGGSIHVPVESILQFRLDRPVRIAYR